MTPSRIGRAFRSVGCPSDSGPRERTGTDRKLIGRQGRIGHTALYGTAWEALPGRTTRVKATPALGSEVCYDGDLQKPHSYFAHCSCLGCCSLLADRREIDCSWFPIGADARKRTAGKRRCASR